MNIEMTNGVIRHIITVIAGAIIASGTDSIQLVINTLFQNLAAGDVSAIVGSSVALLAILWSMWTKATEQTKETIVKKLTFRRE